MSERGAPPQPTWENTKSSTRSRPVLIPGRRPHPYPPGSDFLIFCLLLNMQSAVSTTYPLSNRCIIENKKRMVSQYEIFACFGKGFPTRSQYILRKIILSALCIEYWMVYIWELIIAATLHWLSQSWWACNTSYDTRDTSVIHHHDAWSFCPSFESSFAHGLLVCGYTFVFTYSSLAISGLVLKEPT